MEWWNRHCNQLLQPITAARCSNNYCAVYSQHTTKIATTVAATVTATSETVGATTASQIHLLIIDVQLTHRQTMHTTAMPNLASVTQHYNLVPDKGVISLAGKVTVGLVESNDSLPPSL